MEKKELPVQEDCVSPGHAPLPLLRKVNLPRWRSLWLCACAFRVLWTLAGQQGYIHPDEFFQAPEVLAGDVFGFQVTRTWEFSSETEKPIRSMLLPFLSVGLPFVALKNLNSSSLLQDNGLNVISASTLLMTPRLCMTLLSFIIDWCILKIATSCKLSCYSVLTAFSTSYISTVFYTRTLSNTLEAILFALLLHIVIAANSKATVFQVNQPLPKKEHGSRSSKSSSKSPAKILLLEDPTCGSLPLSLVLVLGFFNRPTFLAFAFVPLAFWLSHSCFPSHRLSLQYVLRRVAALVPGAVVSAALFVSFDSLYYNAISPFELVQLLKTPGNLTHLPHRLVVTPLNFIAYNLDAAKLKSHGQHPFYTHLFNSFLLYGAVGLLLLTSILYKCYSGHKNPKSARSNIFQVRSPHDLLTYSYIFPLAFLSCFAHQEPRFLIPLLIPLSLLHADLVFGPKASRVLTCTWCLWGFVGAVLFGALHQGGVVPSLSYLSQSIHAGAVGCPLNIIFYKTFMPPKHLLALPPPPPSPPLQLLALAGGNVSTNSDDASTGGGCDRVRLLDLMGCSHAVLLDLLRRVVTPGAEVGAEEGALMPGAETLLVAPAVVVSQTFCATKMSDFSLTKLQSFGPHLSMETPPKAADIFTDAYDLGKCFGGDATSEVSENESSWLEKLSNAFSLAVIKVESVGH